VVSNEGLASGASETWSVTAEFTVDAQNFDGSEDDCVQGQENSGDGFYNAVAVSGPNDTATDNDACVNLPPAGINLQKTVTNGPTFDSNTGRYTVVYNIAANNTGGGPGTYDVIDTFTPAAGCSAPFGHTAAAKPKPALHMPTIPTPCPMARPWWKVKGWLQAPAKAGR
jgi:hypothetical protein